MLNRYLLSLLLTLNACAPYANGPVFSTEDANKTFQPILDFMDAKPGMAIADVGAGSGALTVIMATQLDSCIVYIQDIDKKVLEQQNVNKMIAYYSKKLGYDLGKRNTFHITYGALDLIYSNATVHVFDQPDSMLSDLRRKLKPTGRIFIRDSFKDDQGEGEFCSDSKCGMRLYSIDEFLAMMDRNGFQLVEQSPNMSGYPVFGFTSKQ
ncbi:MAG TPA: methyltransferase domain-containing protein [Cyclobacteriaceae bacterium]|nr:methyltransferase domain-containing protein [Cyclobacteriaceae bacterium]